MKNQMRWLTCSLPAILCVAVATASSMDSLHKAVYRGDVDTTRTLLQGGASVNVVDGDGLTPLHYAAVPDPRRTDRSLRMTELLLRHGADPNFVPEHGVTPLGLAVFTASPGVVNLLLDFGGDPNRILPTGISMMTFAETAGRNEVVEILREHGAFRAVTQIDSVLVANMRKTRIYRRGLDDLYEVYGSNQSLEYRRSAARLASTIWPELSFEQSEAIVNSTLNLIDPSAGLNAAARDAVR